MCTSCAISKYKILSPQIFKPGRLNRVGSKIVKPFVGRAWFKGEPLEEAVKSIVRECLPEEEKRLLGNDVSSATLLPSTREMQASVCKMYGNP